MRSCLLQFLVLLDSAASVEATSEATAAVEQLGGTVTGIIPDNTLLVLLSRSQLPTLSHHSGKLQLQRVSHANVTDTRISTKVL